MLNAIRFSYRLQKSHHQESIPLATETGKTLRQTVFKDQEAKGSNNTLPTSNYRLSGGHPPLIEMILRC